MHNAKDPRFWWAAKPNSDTLARLSGLVRGYPEVIGSQLPLIRAQWGKADGENDISPFLTYGWSVWTQALRTQVFGLKFLSRYV